jgi:alpha/beta superfamily hydrolase
LYPAGNLFIPEAHGRLEAILKEPRDVASARGVALVLHPHPLHGGTMHNKVVFRAARALNDAGYVALRINFRGVGLSTGTHDEARGEQDDARAALDYLVKTYPDRPLTLAGFSFGARVGLEVGARDARVGRLIGIGTPVNMYDFDFLRAAGGKPLLLVHGDRDEFGDTDKLRALAAAFPGEVRIEIIHGAGHFFEGHLDEMSGIIREWAEEGVRSDERRRG